MEQTETTRERLALHTQGCTLRPGLHDYGDLVSPAHAGMYLPDGISKDSPPS